MTLHKRGAWPTIPEPLKFQPDPTRLQVGGAPRPARIGDWLQTYTGRQFWPLDPRADEVDAEDAMEIP